MSTSDQPDTPPLTRRQLREIRNTGATPVITPDDAPAVEDTPPPAPAPAVQLPRAAAPAPVAPAPIGNVDLGVSPLTRRQARQQERIRTASVPVISADIAAEHGHGAPVVAAAPGLESASTGPESPVGDAEQPASGERASFTTEEENDGDAAHLEALIDRAEGSDPEPAPLQLNPALGSDLLDGDVPAAALPASFDQLIARNSSVTGSIAAPNALILSQTPAGAPLVAPVAATGEVLITGTFELPEGLGSIGHAPGTADGKDLDVALIDGELPPASSPTPIAASAAISTVRAAGEEIIRPPAPDKGSRLTLALVVTAGVLALTLVGVLVVLITSGRI